MTPEERKMLEETRAIAEETNLLAKSIKRSLQVSTTIKVLYWVVIIALSFGAYYLIQPYVNTLKSSLGDMQGGGAQTADQSTGSTGSSFTLSGALRNLQDLESLSK